MEGKIPEFAVEMPRASHTICPMDLRERRGPPNWPGLGHGHDGNVKLVDVCQRHALLTDTQ